MATLPQSKEIKPATFLTQFNQLHNTQLHLSPIKCPEKNLIGTTPKPYVLYNNSDKFFQFIEKNHPITRCLLSIIP